MPQAILVAAMGLGLYAGYRLARRVSSVKPFKSDGTAERRGQRKPTSRAVRDMGTMSRDPSTGVYRPGS
ncbi:MAG: hypothetical protein AAFO75_10620 [Pseudomonadota bacterium]